jgi:hypothetical protein
MERLEKKEPTKKLTDHQKERIAEINSLYGSRIAEKETFLQGEIRKETAKGDLAAVEAIKDQLNREVRRLHAEWEDKKEHIYAEKPGDHYAIERLKTESPAADQQESA